MLTIPESVKALYLTDGVWKNFRAHFPDGERADLTNENLVQESLRLTESFCSREVFRFGLTEASVLEFETVGVGNLYGATLEASLEIDVSSLTEAQKTEIETGSWDGALVRSAVSGLPVDVYRLPLGSFRVKSCPRNHEAMARRKFTAFSQGFNRRSAAQPGLPSVYPAEQLIADPACWLAQVTGEGLTALSNASARQRSEAKLYSAGHGIQLRFYGADGTTRVYPTAIAAPNDGSAFYLVDGMAVDYAAYYAVGQEIAETIAGTYGTSFCYDADGNQIYSDILTALRDVYPWLFYPALIAVPMWWTGRAWNIYSNPTFSYKLENNKRYPILRHGGFWGDPWGDIVPSGRPGALIEKHEYSAQYFSGADVQSVELYDVTAAQALWRFNLTRHYPTVTGASRVESSRLTDSSGYEVLIRNTGEATPSSNSRGSNVILPRWSYTDAVDAAAMADGCLELQAAFGKFERGGGLSAVRLDNSAPVAIGPALTESCWWDEYEVEPIGAIRFCYQGEAETEQSFVYAFGGGGSVYDMSDNAVLRALDFATAAEVMEILAQSFVPYLDTAAFTPVELRARGLPWIEAGDALSITAADGTVVQTYALRRELSGIQRLRDDVTSSGGELVESEDL